MGFHFLSCFVFHLKWFCVWTNGLLYPSEATSHIQKFQKAGEMPPQPGATPSAPKPCSHTQAHTHTVGHDMFQLSLASPYLDKPVNSASSQKFMDILNAAPFLHLGGRQGAEFTE